MLQDFHNYTTSVHQPMIGAFDDLNGASVLAHISFHPSDGVLGYPFVSIPIPYFDLMRVSRI
jgi:hypothetical protein